MNIFKSHGFMLNRLANTASTQLENELIKKYDLTLSQWVALSIIWEKEGMTLAELQDITNVKVSTASGIIKRMELKDLVKRVPNETDKRVTNLFLTEKSKSLEKEVIQTVKDYNTLLLEGFSKEEKDLLMTFIKRAFTNITE